VAPQFPFVQLEFTHSIGPPAGRYIVYPEDNDASGRSHAGSVAGALPAERRAAPGVSLDGPDESLLGTADVLVVQVRGAPPRSPRRFRPDLPRAPEGAVPRELSVTVVTVVLGTRMLNDVRAARKLLGSIKRSRTEQEQWASKALAILRRGVAAYRASAADPYVPDVSALDARAVRIGYGEAGVVVRGGWEDAFGVAPPRSPRVTRAVRLLPMEGMAAVLTGNGRVLESEELILRVVRDLDHGRNRAAAVGLKAAQELLLAELGGEVLGAQVQGRVETVLAARKRAAELAESALLGNLREADGATLRALAEDAGAAVDAWRYVSLGY
jgi:hypothetical protein